MQCQVSPIFVASFFSPNESAFFPPECRRGSWKDHPLKKAISSRTVTKCSVYWLFRLNIPGLHTTPPTIDWKLIYDLKKYQFWNVPQFKPFNYCLGAQNVFGILGFEIWEHFKLHIFRLGVFNLYRQHTSLHMRNLRTWKIGPKSFW